MECIWTTTSEVFVALDLIRLCGSTPPPSDIHMDIPVPRETSHAAERLELSAWW